MLCLRCCCVGIFIPILLVKMNLVIIRPEHVCFISTMLISSVHDVLLIVRMMCVAVVMK